MIQVAINTFLIFEYLSEDDWQRPKHVGGLTHVCVSLYLIMVLLFVYVCIYIYIYIYIYMYTVCPTRYRTPHFFNNSNTNEDIAGVHSLCEKWKGMCL